MPETFTSIFKDYIPEYRKFVPKNPEDRSDEEDITGKIIIVTGCNTGLGKATVIELVKRGAHVIMACRDLAKTQEAALDIKAIQNDAKLDIMELDLGDLNSVRKFAHNIKEKYTHINILINNAGISKPTRIVEKTKDGFEVHMGVNHLGHFLLTLLLLDHIKKGAPSRIVVVASASHLIANIDLNDLMLENVKSWGSMDFLAYGNSKLANILFTRELSKRLAGSGVTTYALCPGVVKTDIARDNQSFLGKIMLTGFCKLFGFTPEQGSSTTVKCATSKAWALESGQMYRFEKRWDRASDVLDEELGLKLWNLSEELVNIKNSNVKDFGKELNTLGDTVFL